MFMTAISAFRRLRQEDCVFKALLVCIEFQVSQDYTVKPSQKQTKTKQNKCDRSRFFL